MLKKYLPKERLWLASVRLQSTSCGYQAWSWDTDGGCGAQGAGVPHTPFNLQRVETKLNANVLGRSNQRIKIHRMVWIAFLSVPGAGWGRESSEKNNELRSLKKHRSSLKSQSRCFAWSPSCSSPHPDHLHLPTDHFLCDASKRRVLVGQVRSR